jgi:diguanylate cyclase (GGDEF)-like protein
VPDKSDSFFYMAPLVTTHACLKCHGNQGYKEGDIRGGISLTIPSLNDVPPNPLLIAHVFIGILGILGIVFFGKRLDQAYTVLRQQAEIDVLTEIPNRRNFSKKILEEFKRSRRKDESISLLFCDIDNFKEYNDTYGHSAGDRCLRRIAQTLKISLERPGDFCARYGGEEFVVILPETPETGAYTIAEKILKNIRDLKIIHRKSRPVPFITISIGIATAGRALASCEDFINQADQALYKAKNEGKNRAVHFSQDSHV